MEITDLFQKFDQFLLQKQQSSSAIIIGGAALNLLGVVSRYTRDCDVLDPVIPVDIIKSSKEFAKLCRDPGYQQRLACACERYV